MFEEVSAKPEKGQWFAEIKSKELLQKIKLLKAGDSRLITLSGHEDENGFRVVYHFEKQGEILNLSVRLENNLELGSIISIYPNSNLYEREVAEMFNIKITGRAEVKPLFLAEELAGKAPMRKNLS